MFRRYLRDYTVYSSYFRNAASGDQKSDLPEVVQLEGAKLVLELMSEH